MSLRQPTIAGKDTEDLSHAHEVKCCNFWSLRRGSICLISIFRLIPGKEHAFIDDSPGDSFWFFLRCRGEEAGHRFL